MNELNSMSFIVEVGIFTAAVIIKGMSLASNNSVSKTRELNITSNILFVIAMVIVFFRVVAGFFMPFYRG